MYKSTAFAFTDVWQGRYRPSVSVQGCLYTRVGALVTKRD